MTDFALSNSAKIVFSSLKNGSKNQAQLINELKISDRTLRFAISKLKAAGLIIEIISFRDARKKRYFLRGEKHER